MAKTTDIELPAAVRRNIAATGMKVKQGEPRGPAVASVDADSPDTVEVDDPTRFAASKAQTLAHESTHLWQNNLPPAVQAKIPKDNPKDPYNFGGTAGLKAARAQGKTLLDFPRENQAAIVQYYTSQGGDENAPKAIREVYKPFVDDMKDQKLSTILPTQPGQEGIETAARPPQGEMYDTETYAKGGPAPGDQPSYSASDVEMAPAPAPASRGAKTPSYSASDVEFAPAPAPAGRGAKDDKAPTAYSSADVEFAQKPDQSETMATMNPKGLVEPGNLPIWNRPTVQNAGGSHSSELSFSREENGKEVLVPSVIDGKFATPDGKIPPLGKQVNGKYVPTPEEKAMQDKAWQHYKDTGENLGKFKDPDSADAYAGILHNRGNAKSQAELSAPGGVLPGIPGAPQVNMTTPSLGATLTGESKTAKPTQMYDYPGEGTGQAKEGLELLAKAWGDDFSFNSHDAKVGLTQAVNGVMNAGATSLIGQASPMALRALAGAIAGGYITGDPARKIAKAMGADPDTQDFISTMASVAGGAALGGVLGSAFRGRTAPGYHNGEGVHPAYQAPPEPEEAVAPKKPSVEVPEEKALPAPKPATHPAGKVTAYDAKDGLPIVDRSQPSEEVKAEPEKETPAAKAEAPAKESAETPKGEVLPPQKKAAKEAAKEPVTLEGKIGEKDPDSGRTILQPSDSAAENQKLATAGLKEILPSIKETVAGVQGAALAGVRPEKDADRTKEKVEDENKPPATIPDYSALRISVDSPKAREDTVAALRDQFPVVRDKDEFDKGSPAEGFHAHMLQVQSPNGASHELQVLPKEQADIAEETHELYEKARDGDKDAQAQLKESNDAAMESFRTRNTERPEKATPTALSQGGSDNETAAKPAKTEGASEAKINASNGSSDKAPLAKGTHVVLPDGRSAKVDFYDGKLTKKARVTTETGEKIDSVPGKDLTPLSPVALGKPNTTDPREAEIQKRTAEQGPQLVAKYLKANTKPNGVISIATDAAKELFPEFQSDRTGNDRIVASSASQISKAAQRTALAAPIRDGRDVVRISTASPGSGKTQSLFQASENQVGMDIESIMDDPKAASDLVKSILDSGRKPEITWIYVDDFGKTVQRMLTRAAGHDGKPGIGRTVQLSYMAHAYREIPATLEALQKEFGNRLKVTIANNSGPKGAAIPYTGELSRLAEEVRKQSTEQLERRANEELERLQKSGAVPENIARAARETDPGGEVRGLSRRPAAGDGGQHEQPAKRLRSPVLKEKPAEVPEEELAFRHGGFGAVNPANLVPNALRDYLTHEAELVATSRKIHGGLYDLAEQYDADVLRAGKLLKSLPGTPADEEAAYHHQENPKERLTKTQQAILTKLAPFDKEAERIYQKLNPDKKLTANYVHRIAQQKGSLLDRVLSGSKSTGKGNVLKKSASASKKRSMMAIESTAGKAREVVSVARGRVTEWHDNIPRDLGALRSGLTTKEDILDERLEPLEREEKKLKAEQRTLNETKSRQAAAGRRLQNIANRLQQIEADRTAIEHEHLAENLPDKGWRDKEGRLWTFKNATTKEIEANTPIRYYKNAAASTVTNWLELRKAERASDYIEGLKNDPAFNDLAIKPKNPGQIPEGWKSTQLPQLMGYYFEPHVAEVFDHYAKQLAKGSPGILQQVGDFLTTSIFLNPVAHLPNLTANWLTEKGVAVANPFGWGKEFKAGVKAFNAVVHKNQDFLEALDAGAPLQSQKIEVHQFADLLAKKLQEEAGNTGVLEKLRDALGTAVNVPGAVKAAVDFMANKSTFPVHDIYLLQSAYLKTGRGMTMKEALQDTAKYIPNERLPTRIFNSKALADLMANPALTMFSRYHYGVLKGWGQIFKNISGTGFKEEGTNPKGEPVNSAGRTADQEKLHALNIAAGLALMMAVVYPALDELAKKATGNKDARARRAGYSTFADALARAYRGDVTWQQAARTAVTPAVGTETAVDLAANRDVLGTGKKIYDPHAGGKVIAQQVGRRLAEAVSPAQLALRASESAESTKKMLYGLIGISFPKHGALKFAAELNADRMGDKPETEQQREKGILLSQARYAAWQGDKSGIEEAKKSGRFTAFELFKLQKAAREDPLVYETHGMGIEDVLKVFDHAATPEEKKSLTAILRQKAHLVPLIKDKDERIAVGQKVHEALYGKQGKDYGFLSGLPKALLSK